MEVNQLRVFSKGGRVVGVNFFHLEQAPYKISTQHLKAFRSYPIVKFENGKLCLEMISWEKLFF